METTKRFGDVVARLRREKGLTQEQLAACVGVSAPAVSKWETGSSYPDITLLCPLARALGTNVDTLLQFEETLSDQEVVARINEILGGAIAAQGDLAGYTAALDQLEELLHRYPNCIPLAFNGALALDSFRLFFPALEQDEQNRLTARKKALLEQVRASGDAAYWQTATLQLAGLALAEEKIEKTEALLKELPEHAADPTFLWAQLYRKKGQPEEAVKVTQKRLYSCVQQLQLCLMTLGSPELLGNEQARKVCEVLGQTARLFGLLDTSSGLLMELCLRVDDREGAAKQFARYVDTFTGPAVLPDEDLFRPGMEYTRTEGQLASTREMRRMLLKAVDEDARFGPLQDNPVFAAALQKLKDSLN